MMARDLWLTVIESRSTMVSVCQDEGVDGSDADGEWSDGSDADKTDDADG